MRWLAALPLLLLVLAGCSGDDKAEGSAAAKPRPACPAASKPEWQQLANRVQAPVYCPSWMPSPLDADIGGQWNSDGPIVDKDRSYLVGFLWHEAGAGDVHVNFRGYPRRTAVPRCKDGKQRVPCFSDARGTKRIGDKNVTVYTVSRDADQWHVTFLWRRDGTLYTASEHVAPPFTFGKVVSNLERLVGGLDLIKPNA
ncbi:MAG: hypothetical protein ACJ75P_05290 [Gaiellaceae bacterium]